MDGSFQFARAVLRAGASFEQKLAGFQRHFERERAFPQPRVHVVLQVRDLLIEDRRERLQRERLIGDDAIDAVDEFGRKALADGHHSDAAQLAGEIGPGAGAGRLEAEIGVDLAQHFARAQVAGEEDQALFEIDDVLNATSAQLETLFGAMAEIEAACARLAAMSMTPIERRRLENPHESMAALARRGDRDGYAAANVAFHACVYRAHIMGSSPISPAACGAGWRCSAARSSAPKDGSRARRSTPSSSRRSSPATRPRRTPRCSDHMSLVEDSFGRLGLASRASA